MRSGGVQPSTPAGRHLRACGDWTPSCGAWTDPRALEAVLPRDDLSSLSEKAYHFMQALPAGFGNEALEHSRRAARMAASGARTRRSGPAPPQRRWRRGPTWPMRRSRPASNSWAKLGPTKSRWEGGQRGGLTWNRRSNRRSNSVKLSLPPHGVWVGCPNGPRPRHGPMTSLNAYSGRSHLTASFAHRFGPCSPVWQSFLDDPEYRRTAGTAWRTQAIRNDAITAKVFSLISLYDPYGFPAEQLIRLGEDLGDAGYVSLGWRNVGSGPPRSR